MRCSLHRFLGTHLLLASLVGTSWGKDAAPPGKNANAASTADDQEHSAEAPSRPSDMPLSLLPEPPSLELPAPRPQSLEAIDAILARISGEDAALRERAQRELLEVRPDWVSGLSKRLDRIAERADKPAMRTLMERLRARAKKGALSAQEESTSSDYLTLVLASPEPSSAVWRDLSQLLAVGRMLRHIGSAEAVREIIRVYVRFGEFMRVSTQRELDELGDRQVAGLWEAARHPAQKISSWAQKRLDLLGKAIPHEAVRTKDQAALAEILVALGRSRNPDVGRVLISFAATERIQVRTAARQGIALLGEVASWQLRDAYQDTTGKLAPRDWTWKRTARELFTEFDRLRSSKVFELFEQGRKAEERSDYKVMQDAYDQVLAVSPLFEQRELMAPGYVKRAHELASSDPLSAISALRRAERIAASDADRKKAGSLRHVVEARLLEEGGIVDRGLIDKALALDPESSAAQDALARSRLHSERLAPDLRYLLAGTIAALSFAGAAYVAWIAFRRRRSRNAAAPPPASPDDTAPLHPLDVDDDLAASLSRASSPSDSEPLDEAPDEPPSSPDDQTEAPDEPPSSPDDQTEAPDEPPSSPDDQTEAPDEPPSSPDDGASNR